MKHYRNLIFILVIAALAIYLDLPNNRGLTGTPVETHLGLDLVGGAQVLLEADVPAGQGVESEQMDAARSIVENRVTGFTGSTEAVVQRSGDRFIVVEIPGAEDPEEAISLIRTTALLEFVDMSEISGDQARQYEGQAIVTDYQTSQTPAEGEKVWHTVMTGSALKSVRVVQPEGTFQPVVQFSLNSDAVRAFSEYTRSHVNTPLAIVLDKVVISAPVIEAPLTDGGVITGDFDEESANLLALQLRSGSLPVPLKVAETRTVGPSLGQDSLQKSLVAGLIGFTIVILFMALYYRLPGILADISILIYAAITFAIFRYFEVTLTLPGIAGLMLSTGSALDANILIFERIKEELRDGRPLLMAVDKAWDRAWSSIRDSNFATVITCTVLFLFGSAYGATIVRGFSVTLLLGVVVSLFTALFVTRTLLGVTLQLIPPEKINLARWFGI